MPEHDPFAGTTGLKDDFDGEITEVKFGYDSDYNNGQTLIANINITADDGDEILRKLSTGSGWEADSKGEVASREDGSEPKGFNRSAMYQQFLEAAMAAGAGDVMRGTGAMPWEAAVWGGGLRFHFGIVRVKGFQGAENDTLMPTAFLGAGEKKASGKKAAAPKAASNLKPAAASVATNGDLPAVMKVKLKKAAQAAGSHEEFMELAFEIDGAESYEEIIADDSEEGFYVLNATS